MEEIVISLAEKTLSVGLVLYYVFVVMPRQETRYDAVVDKIIIAQKECSDKMNIALEQQRSSIEKHNESIDELIHLIESKK
jgi:hypothetical protein